MATSAGADVLPSASPSANTKGSVMQPLPPSTAPQASHLNGLTSTPASKKNHSASAVLSKPAPIASTSKQRLDGPPTSAQAPRVFLSRVRQDQPGDTHAQLQALQAKTSKNFAEALASDQRLALQPDVTSPFTSAEDVVRRLLPYHVFQLPEGDLLYSIEQHKQQNKNVSLKRKRRQSSPVAVPNKAASPIEAAVDPEASQTQAAPQEESKTLASTPEPGGADSGAVVQTSTEAPVKRKPRLRVKPPAPVPSIVNGKGKEKAKEEVLDHVKPSAPLIPPEFLLPWWEASVEDDNFPSTTKAIELFERHASLTERIQKALIRLDGGELPAQNQIFMETHLDRLGLEYERECLQAESIELNETRSKWEAVVRSKKTPVGPTGPSIRPSVSTTPGQIPQHPIPLHIPLSMLPRLTSLGISPVPAPHLVPILAAGNTQPGGQLKNIGPATAPRPPPPDQPEPALLTGITQASGTGSSSSGQFLHVSVRLDKLVQSQLSGLAALMASLQSNAANPTAGSPASSPRPPPLSNGSTAPASQK